MAQIVSRGGSRLTPVSVVTVADLLSRNAPATTKLAVNETGIGVSVGSLLRREGRAPHALDRPVQPRAHQELEGADEPTSVHAVVKPAGKTAIVKRGAVAAGALLAVGSVIGAAALTEIAPTGTEAQGAQGDGWAGQGRLDQSSAAPVLPTASVIDPASTTADALDAGTAAPSSWVPVAFPTAIAGVPTVLAAANGAPSSAVSGASQSTGSPSVAPSAPAAGASAARTTENPAPPAPPTAAGNSGDSAVQKVGNTLGSGVENVGSALPGPVGKTAQGLGTTVKDTGNTLNKVTAPVTDKLSPVTGPVVSLLSTDSSARTSAPQQADKESSSDNDDKDSRDSRSDDKNRGDDGDSDGGSSGGLLGGVGKVAAGLLGG